MSNNNNHENDIQKNDVLENRSNKQSKTKRLLIVAILLSAFTGIVISYMRRRGIDSSALLYIGIPTFIALAFAFTSTSKSKSIMGSTLKAITFIILISGPLLQEGYICMIMAAPILYIIGALAAWPFDHYRKKKQNGSKLNMIILPALLVFMSMEGVIDETSFNRFNTVEHEQIINSSIADIRKRIGSSRPLDAPNSLFAKIFPRPDTINANGIDIGDTMWIDVSYFKWIYWNEKRGKVQYKVTENEVNYLKFSPTMDSSYFKSYMTWKDTVVILKPVSKNKTKVTWRISFQRDIDPAWYAQPLQRYAVAAAAEVLVESLQ